MNLDEQYDVVIVGGGLIGMSMAAALAATPLKILLLEQEQMAAVHANLLDLRTTGLTCSSKKVLTEAGVWPDLVQYATPIEQLEISEVGRMGCARIDGDEHGISPIGYMLPNQQLISVLSDKLNIQKNITLLSPASVYTLRQTANEIEVAINQDGLHRAVRTSLLVGADGASSKVRQLLNIGSSYKEYKQTAIITNVQTQLAHQNKAFERFTANGPLAVLPIQDNHCALIWTHATEQAKDYQYMDDQSFLLNLQAAFGYRLGKFIRIGKRVMYPLSLTTSNQLCKSNAVLIGNAAQSVHPVAAQGLNLGLRDVQALVRLLERETFDSARYTQMLVDYEQQRKPDRDHVIRLTDGLTRVFAANRGPIKSLRSCGIRMVGALPSIQRILLRRNLGMRYFMHPFG